MTSASVRIRAGEVEPPAVLLPAITIIKKMVEAAGVASPEPAQITRFHDSAESLISILGKRGSGKTTILAAACASLERTKSALVLPTIRPELFEATDSLLLAMLLEIENWLVADIAGQHISVDRSDLGPALAEAMRSVSSSSPGAYSALASGSESTGQYGIDAVAIVRHRSRLTSSLTALFAVLRQHFGYGDGTPVVVPVDDADMSPANLRSILTAVRVLGAIPGVVPVICADRRQLEIATLADIHQQYGGHIGDGAADRLAAQVVAKLLRPERCVAPPVLPERDRAKFAPIGQGRSIEQLLDDIGGTARTHRSLRTLIWKESEITQAHEPDGVNAWLPETPRELEYLWETILALVESDQYTDVGIRAQHVQRFIDHVLASSREFEVSVETKEPSKRKRPQPGPAIRLRWPTMNYGVTAEGRYTPAATNKELRLRLRRLNYVGAALYLNASRVKTTADEQDQRQQLSPAGVSSMEALQALVASGYLGECPASPSMISEQQFEFLQNITINGERTDDLFLSMPDSCGVQAITRAAIAWNRLVDDARTSNRDRNGAGSTIRRFMQLVIRYWLLGDERVLVARRPPSLERSMEVGSLEYLKHVGNDDISHIDDYSAERSYCHWFECRLPYLFHPAILGPGKVETIVGRWLDAISAGPRAVEATSVLRTALEGRFARQFDEERRRKLGENSWIYGYHVLARHIGTELYADMLMFKDAYEERRRSRVVGHDILGDSIGLSGVKGPYQFAPHRTVEGDEEMKVLREVLEQYRSR